MARTPSVSDEEIIAAARKVIRRRGADAFTLSEVASDVGLSRAAIILRFKSTHDLKVRILTSMVEQFIRRLEVLPDSPGGDSLLEVAAFIGGYAGNQDSSSSFFADFSGNLKDPELAALEQKRGDALHRAISRAMPGTSIDHDSATIAFRAHLTGSILAWVALPDTLAGTYLVERTREWLRLAGIPFSENATSVCAETCKRV